MNDVRWRTRVYDSPWSPWSFAQLEEDMALRELMLRGWDKITLYQDGYTQEVEYIGIGAGLEG